jgi:hypothetical protein
VVSLGIFSVASDNSMCPRSTQPLKMSTRILLGVKTAGAYGYNLPPSTADITETGSLNLPEPSGSHRPVMGMLYLYFCIQIISDQRRERSPFLVKLIRPVSPNNQHHFFTFHLFTAPSSYTSTKCLRLSAALIILPFKNRITDRT